VERISLIRNSLFAFTCGLLGLLPLIGFPCGVISLVMFIRIRYQAEDWNPAERYLNWAPRFALIGFVLTFLVFVMISLAIVSQSYDPRWNEGYIGTD